MSQRPRASTTTHERFAGHAFWACLLGSLALSHYGCAESTNGAALPSNRDLDASVDIALDEPPSEEEFMDELCRKARPCCASAHVAGGAAECRSKLEQLSAQSHYDSFRALTCLNQLRAVALDDDGCPSDWIAPFCKGVFYSRGGSKAPGESCGYDNAECSAPPGKRALCGPLDQADSTAKTAHCRALARAAEAEPCDAMLDPVGAIAWNSYSWSEHQADAGYCDSAEGLFCDPLLARCVQGPVSPRLERGASCSPIDYELSASAQCEPDSFCSITSFKCALKVELGEPCDSKVACVSGNCASGHCAPAFGGIALDLVCGVDCQMPDWFASDLERAAWICRL